MKKDKLFSDNPLDASVCKIDPILVVLSERQRAIWTTMGASQSSYDEEYDQNEETNEEMDEMPVKVAFLPIEVTYR